MAGAVEQIMVAFEGEGAGEDGFSWGQKEYWPTIVGKDDWRPMGGVKPLPAATSVEEIADELRYLMERYQALRTRVRFGAGARPLQVLYGSGQIPLEIVDSGDADPGKIAEEVCDRYRDTPLDFTAEWPIRMGVVRRQGQLTHMAVLISHFAIDAIGAAIMMAEVAQRASTPVAGMQPLAQAAWQQSAAGQRQNAAALRYWEGILRTIDPPRFIVRDGELHGEHSPRYWLGEFTSPVMAPAVRAIVRDSGAGASTVFLALFAVALEEVVGDNPVVVRPAANNRFRPGLAGVVCTVVQAGLCLLDVAGLPFDEVLRRTQSSLTKANKHAYFDDEDVAALRSRIARERGIDLDLRCFFNDRRSLSDAGESGPAPVPALNPRQALETAAPNSFRWVIGRDRPWPTSDQLAVTIDDVPDADAVRVSLHLDTQSLSLAAAETFARTMEEVACAAACYRPRVSSRHTRAEEV